jgi:hypothetical protein
MSKFRGAKFGWNVPSKYAAVENESHAQGTDEKLAQSLLV